MSNRSSNRNGATSQSRKGQQLERAMTTQQLSVASYLNSLDHIELQSELAAVNISTCNGTGGRMTYLYRYGSSSSPTIIILPPTGMSFMLISKLALALSSHFHVLSWESRGCPNSDVEMSAHDAELESQVAEFAAIIESQRIREFHFVGWCQAAQNAVLACHSSAPFEPLSLSLIAPAGLGYAVLPSEFERCALPIYLHIASRDLAYAATMSKLLDTSAGNSNTQDQLPERLSLVHLSSPETTFRFAQYMKAFNDSRLFIKPLVGDVIDRVPTQIIHCKDDTFSHYSESVQLARSHLSARLTIFNSGGHLLMFNQADVVAELIGRFITGVRSHGASTASLQVSATRDI